MTEVRPATQTAHNEAGYVMYINATWHTVSARDEWQDLIHVFTPSSPQIIRDWGGEGGGWGGGVKRECGEGAENYF